MTEIHVRDNNIKIRDPEEITICKSKFFCTIPYKKKTFYALGNGLVCLVNLQIKISKPENKWLYDLYSNVFIMYLFYTLYVYAYNYSSD